MKPFQYSLKDDNYTLELDKQEIVGASTRLYKYIMETKERAILEVLALNCGKDALVRLRDAVNGAIKMVDELGDKPV
jgi:hypothetical protein